MPQTPPSPSCQVQECADPELCGGTLHRAEQQQPSNHADCDRIRHKSCSQRIGKSRPRCPGNGNEYVTNRRQKDGAIEEVKAYPCKVDELGLREVAEQDSAHKEKRRSSNSTDGVDDLNEEGMGTTSRGRRIIHIHKV